MKITSVQKIIKVGSSIGVTIPSKDAKAAGFKTGDLVVVSLEALPKQSKEEKQLILAAEKILKRYK